MARQAEHQAKRQLRGGIGIAPRGVEPPGCPRAWAAWVSIFTGFARVQAGDPPAGADRRPSPRPVTSSPAGHQHLGVVGQLNQLTGAEFRFAQRPPLHQQLAQLVEGAKVASMLGGKNGFSWL